MDETKIKNFRASHPGVDLLEFCHLHASDCDQLRTTFAVKLGLKSGASGLEVLQAMERRAWDVPGFRPNDGAFRLNAALKELKIHAPRVYINWYRFDDIDEMPTMDLDQWFHDLWYPDSDDIELFDQSLGWVLFVRHFDVLQIARL